LEQEIATYETEFKTQIRLTTGQREFLSTQFKKFNKKQMSVSQFKQSLRNLGLIPHFSSDYKATKVFKYLLQQKNPLKPQTGLKDPDFQKAVYLLFSLSVDSGDASLAQKTGLLFKWARKFVK